MYDEMDAKRDGLVADAEALELSARSTTDYLGAAKMMKAAEAKRKAASQITPASWKAAKFLEAKLTYDKVENPEQRRTRRDVKSVSKSLYRAATQPIASRWRNHRREVAIGDIKTNYRKATVDIPEKQLKLEEKRDRIQEKLNNVQNRRQARRNP